MPASNVSVTAQWTINQYTIAFDSDGGTSVATQTNDYNTVVVAPADPTRDGFTFLGWNPPLPATMPASNVSVTAQWTAVPYTMTVVSAYGVPSPQGTNIYGWNDAVSASMTTLTELDGGNSNIQYECIGWVRIGCEPDSGPGTNMPSFNITNDTTVTWQWATNYWINFSVQGN
jgi:hypothetical protein